MFDTMTRYLEVIFPTQWRWQLRKIFLPLVDRYSSQPLATAGLIITSGGATTAKIGATDFYACVKGVIVKIAAATNMPALTGLNIAAGAYNVVCFYTDSAANVTAAMGTPGATVGAVVFPVFPENQSLIGFLIITYASAFTGGTTPLDTATTVYISPLGAFDPSVLV
jgi:hypothetical protein